MTYAIDNKSALNDVDGMDGGDAAPQELADGSSSDDAPALGSELETEIEKCGTPSTPTCRAG